MELPETNPVPPKKKTGNKPKQLISVEVVGYEIGRGPTKKVVFDDDVYKLAAMGCNNREISVWFDCDEDTLKRNFAPILAKGREHLKQTLRQAQIRLALSGNATMLIWLGKNLLGQSDNPFESEGNAPLPWSDEDE